MTKGNKMKGCMLSVSTTRKYHICIRCSPNRCFFLLGLQETWNKLHHILPGQIDYLDVAGTVCALTVMYVGLLSRFASLSARSEHTLYNA